MKEQNQGYDTLEKLRKKVTHDVEHQINDLLKLRDFVSEKVGVEVAPIEKPKVGNHPYYWIQINSESNEKD